MQIGQSRAQFRHQRIRQAGAFRRAKLLLGSRQGGMVFQQAAYRFQDKAQAPGGHFRQLEQVVQLGIG